MIQPLQMRKVVNIRLVLQINNDVDEDPAKTLNEEGEYFDNQTHTSTKPITRNKAINESCKYACNQCDYQATHQGNLTVHIQSKHEGVKYACNKCDQQFTTRRSMARHIKSMHEQGTQV